HTLLEEIELKCVCLFQPIKLLRKERFPTQAVVQGQTRRHFPTILTVDSQVFLGYPKRIRKPLHQTLQPTDHKIRKTIKRKDAAAERRVMAVGLISHRAHTKRHLMVSFHDADIVRELNGCPRPMQVTRPGAAEIKSSGNTHRHKVCGLVPNVDS